MSQDIYCRLCAMKVENFVNIYDKEGESINLAAKIVQCLQIWVSTTLLPLLSLGLVISCVNSGLGYSLKLAEAYLVVLNIGKK